MDLQGPKLRLGTFAKGPMELKNGQKLRFDLDKAPGTASACRCRIPRSSRPRSPAACC